MPSIRSPSRARARSAAWHGVWAKLQAGTGLLKTSRISNWPCSNSSIGRAGRLPGERREQPGLALEDGLGRERAGFGELDRGHGVARGEAGVEVHLAAAGMRPLVEPRGGIGGERERVGRARLIEADQPARRDGGGDRADQAGRAEQPGELRGHQRPADPAARLVARDCGRKTGSAADAECAR